MPSTRLLEGDLDILLKKVSSVEGKIDNLKSIVLPVVSYVSAMMDSGIDLAGMLKSLMNEMDFVWSTLCQFTGAKACAKAVVDSSATVHAESNSVQPKSYSAVVIDSNDSGPTTTSLIHNKLPWSERVARDQPSGNTTDCESDNAAFSLVSSKSVKRNNKRKSSPILNQPSKKASTITADNRQPASRQQDTIKATARITNNALIGNADCCKLRAAGMRQQVEKSVYCVSNLSTECSVNDIRAYCKDLNIRVLFCFDVTNANFDSKAFKLAVPANDAQKILDGSSWPRDVVIRPWGRPATTTAASDKEVVSNICQLVSRGDHSETASPALTAQRQRATACSPVPSGDTLLNSTVVEIHGASNLQTVVSSDIRSATDLSHSLASLMESDDPFCLDDETILTQIPCNEVADESSSKIKSLSVKDG